MINRIKLVAELVGIQRVNFFKISTKSSKKPQFDTRCKEASTDKQKLPKKLEKSSNEANRINHKIEARKYLCKKASVKEKKIFDIQKYVTKDIAKNYMCDGFPKLVVTYFYFIISKQYLSFCPCLR